MGLFPIFFPPSYSPTFMRIRLDNAVFSPSSFFPSSFSSSKFPFTTFYLSSSNPYLSIFISFFSLLPTLFFFLTSLVSIPSSCHILTFFNQIISCGACLWFCPLSWPFPFLLSISPILSSMSCPYSTSFRRTHNGSLWHFVLSMSQTCTQNHT